MGFRGDDGFPEVLCEKVLGESLPLTLHNTDRSRVMPHFAVRQSISLQQTHGLVMPRQKNDPPQL